ncbi:MAG: DUF86 domain-containing protein [Thermofilaceae archaeon]
MPEVDVKRVERLLAEIEESLSVISEALSGSMDEFLSDIRSVYAVRYAIVKTVEAAVLVGIHILESKYGAAVETYSEVFEELGRRGVVSRDVSEGLRRLVGLRNILVHRYWSVDDARIYKEAKEGGINVVRKFVNEVKRCIAG